MMTMILNIIIYIFQVIILVSFLLLGEKIELFALKTNRNQFQIRK